MKNISRQHIKLTLVAMALLLVSGAALAQNDPQFVIKKDNHYLAHTGSGSSAFITDATTFNPATCLWYSGPNIEYNYYFIDNNGNYRYLSAPLTPSAELSLSASHPGTAVLNKTTENYYFYDWDNGVARGIQLDLEDCANGAYNGLHHDNQTGEDQCWKVVWVSYEEYQTGSWRWQMSSEYGYDPTTYSARFSYVTVTEHTAQVVPAAEPGGAPSIADFAIAYGDAAHPLNGTASNFNYSYTPAYTSYTFNGNTYFFDANGLPLSSEPGTSTITNDPATGYTWTLTGPGAEYLSLSNTAGANTTVSCTRPNTTTSHKMATLTLTVTYQSGGTEVRTATVTVKTTCQNPLQAVAPVVSYENVTLSWLPTADKYKLEYKKSGENWNQATSIPGITTSTYTLNISDLEYSQAYDYRVAAFCDGSYLSVDDELVCHFTTHAEPDVIILGAVYGGGRMANVTGNTEVLIINCDSVNAVFGGNDIAGVVNGGSNIILGLDADNDHDSYSYIYNQGNASTKVRVFDVYGGGNGYYAYNGTSIVPASYNTTYDVANGASIMAITPSHPEGEPMWTNNTGSSQNWICPTISKAEINVTNNSVKIDSLFGGAKNAILNNTTNDVNITINGGTLYTVFGGNNFGGSLGYHSKEYITVNHTTTQATLSDYQAGRLGRDFGIGYLYGGGNRVQGQHIEINITGGQMDTIFGGGNSADVRSTSLIVNCGIGEGSGNNTFGDIYSKAIYSSTTTGIDSIDAAYKWDGKGIYNIRTLFGGNNKATMSGLPVITLTSGSLGTVYGGGNAGEMMAQTTGGSITFPAIHSFENFSFDYSTKVMVDQPNVLVDYLYGGCQMSNVGYSSWVRLLNGHVGTVYGGCNISGDVGSTRQDMSQPATNPGGLYQKVYGATYVEALGGTVYNDIFAGSNGFYHCVNGYGIYTNQITYDPDGHSYVGMKVPTHNETHVVLNGSVIVNHNVYAGGNMAPVGFTPTQTAGTPYPQYVGMASVRMLGGEVKGDVYGGGRMASINGSNEVRVTGGRIGTGPNGGALYGGNDRLGKAGGITNRVLPETYNTASDNNTPLTSSDNLKKVNTYVGVTGNPQINTVYGGGNGAYNYDGTSQGGDMDYCDATDKPIQSNIFVDIALDGGDDGGYIENVYGGGNGVFATGFIKVFLNIQECDNDTRDHVGTIFGGNNLGEMDLIPDIILLNGNVHNVYGGCNKGSLVGDSTLTVNNVSYDHIGGYVHLRKEYTVTNTTVSPAVTTTTPTTASVTGAVYGGCRMNGVDNNTLVLVDGGTHPANFFGGSDISGEVGLTSRVIVNGGTVGNVYGGGNGNYYYDGNSVYDINDHSILIDAVETGTISAPVCSVSQVDILGGQVGASGENGGRNIFGGGLGAGTQTTDNVAVNIGPATATSWEGLPFIYGNVYGGSAFGSVNSSSSNTTTVNFLNGTLHGNVFGGGLGDPDDDTKGWTKGVVTVNISNEAQSAANCFIDLRDASVFGCNNTNGSPQDDVTVNVYKTAHNYADYTTGNNYTAANGIDPYYSIAQVFGGGNEADYAPENGSSNSAKKATVNIFSCDNTIRQVFGGGNAAAAIGVATNVYGGRFDQVFGGGNGSGGAANIGSGGTNLMVSGGIIRQLFGGSNLNGTITGDMRVNVTNSGDCTEDITEFFGGSNEAPIEADLTTTIGCNTQHPVNITDIYGGSNLAAITGNVTLNINGGNFSNVYAGSKGIAGSGASTGTPANITGNTTLNLYGGTIDKAFGGCNANGNITGTIQVNLEDTGDCPLQVNTVYGGGNLASYTPTYTPASGTEHISPEVNVKHATVNDAVYGGGLGASATITANPIVTIGDNVAGHRAIVGSTLNGTTTQGEGNVFGGGDAAAVNGSTLVVYDDQNTASQVNRLFGGGNEAGVSSAIVNMNHGKVLTGIYGGCNSQGTVGGDIEVNINGGTLGVEGTPMTSGIFGGGFGQPTQTSGNVVLNVGDGTHAPTIYGDVYGGSALGKVNTQGTTTQKTTVYFANGNLHGYLYGGGLGQAGSPGIPAEVYGSVEVNIGKDKNNNTISGGTIYGSVFGANNVKGSPEGSVTVNVYSATIDSIFGGGNQANYTPLDANSNYPALNIYDGTITHKVVGGGNAAGVTANPVVNISGGTLCNSTDYNLMGIYGGCNTSGTVGGNVTLNITGSETSHTTIGTMAALENETPVNVHGGGYGADTEVSGNVIVNYGTDEVGGTHCEYPMLYGDMYGGSALGNVNTDGSNTTTVKVLNGSFKSKLKVNGTTVSLFGGDVYGGGLGDVDHEAKVNGKVYVSVGEDTPSGTIGQASFSVYNVDGFTVGSKVFGCNNANGSPQDEVYLNVYQTAHTPKDLVTYFGSDRTYAISDVFGGGNRAHYDPNGSMKAYTYIHNCDNTIGSVYGGGNAADALGVVVNVDGGRFEYIFGGGNGQVIPANIGDGGIELMVCSGHVGYKYVGCDAGGNVIGPMQDKACDQDPKVCDENLVVDYFFFGANQATIIGGLVDTIYCNGTGGDPMNYMNVYAGSRLAVIYGDIYLVVRGGHITNLFGGSQGSLLRPGDVRRYPHLNNPEEMALVPEDAYEDMVQYLQAHPGVEGTGGNIYMKLEGGTLRNVYGGNELRGNVDGDIIIVVNSNQVDCPLSIDTIYGGNMKAVYTPKPDGNGSPRTSPQVYLQNGTVNYYVFGGSLGDVDNPGGDAGKVISNPYVVIGDDANTTTHTAMVGKDVFGGGSTANVNGNTKVVLRGKANIEGDVFGGSKHGDVNGSTDVQVVPATSDTPVIPPPPTPPTYTLTYSVNPTGSGFIEVTNNQGIVVENGSQIAEGALLHITARNYTGHTFVRWEAANGTVTRPSHANTSFIMGSGNATLEAIFE